MINNICNDLFDFSRDWYVEGEFDPDGQLIYRPPPLSDFWLDEPGRLEQKENYGKQRHFQEKRIWESNKSVPEPDII